MKVSRLLAAIPVLPAVGGWFTNRRRPHSRVCAPADVLFNAGDFFFGFTNRVRRGGLVQRNEQGHHAGSLERLP